MKYIADERPASELTDAELKARQDNHKAIMKEATKRHKAAKNKLLEKDYILTVYQEGDLTMSGGNPERMVDLRRFYVPVSLSEINDYMKFMTTSFWTHPDMTSGIKNEKDIPFEEKKWGRYSNIVIEPLSEELEKDYVGSSELGFFKHHREILHWELEKDLREVA